MRIILDVMSGDNAPLETLKGAVNAKAQKYSEGVDFTLVGDENIIKKTAEGNKLDISGFEIRHTDVVLTMEDDPMAVMKEKKDSSLAMGLKMLANGEGDAFVSAGNTGALFAGASLIVRKVRGLRRPALAALLPMNPPVLLLDSGANVVVSADDLEQFAVMGTAYMRALHGVDDPRVGLLNNGAEEHKGTEMHVEAYRRLRDADVHFVGNVEGNRVMADACDVLVTDGFTGNVLLKTAEGMGTMMLGALKNVFYANLKTKIGALLVKSKLMGMKKQFDTREYGGAPILGIQKPVIKAHGSSDAKAFKNAIRQALAAADAGLCEEIADTMAAMAAKKAEAAEKSASENS